jgi:hypothetical protein
MRQPGIVLATQWRTGTMASINLADFRVFRDPGCRNCCRDRQSWRLHARWGFSKFHIVFNNLMYHLESRKAFTNVNGR